MNGKLLQFGRGTLPGNPITTDIELAMRLQELCGAEGYRIEGNQVLALRWIDGVERVIERFELQSVNA